MVDLCFRGDIDPNCRLLEDQHLCIRFHPPRDDDLLLVTAAERRNGLLRVMGFHREAPDCSYSVGHLALTADDGEHLLAGRNGIEIDVLSYRKTGCDALLRPSA